MPTTVTPEFEKLCDREFELESGSAYDGFERDAAQIKEHFNAQGCYWSAATGQAVKEAALARFDRVLAAFDRAYLAKFRDDLHRPLTDEDVAWLHQKVTSRLEPAASEAETKCNTQLWEPRLYFAQYWGAASVEARQRKEKFRRKIEILHLQKGQQPVKPQAPALRANPFGELDVPDDSKAGALLEELRICYDGGCWNACGILVRIVTERALDAIEPACRRKKGLGNKLAYCLQNSGAFGHSMKEALGHLTAGKVTGDIVAHDSAIVIGQSDVDIGAPYFRHLVSHWCAASPKAINGAQGTELP